MQRRHEETKALAVRALVSYDGGKDSVGEGKEVIHSLMNVMFLACCSGLVVVIG